MNPDVIEDHELLYRVVRSSYPDAFIDGKPSAALFMDPGGVSVDRDGGRPESDIIEAFQRRFAKRQDYKTTVKITASECVAADTYPVPTGNRKNKYHAEIHDSEEVVEISLFKAMQLAARCREVAGEV